MDIFVKESIRFAEAQSHQKSILEFDIRHDGSSSYRALARAVLRYWKELRPEEAGLGESYFAHSEAGTPSNGKTISSSKDALH